MDAEQRETLLLRLQQAEEKLERRRTRQSELERENRQLRSTLESERENSAAVAAYFKKQAADKTKEVLALEERLAMLEQEHEAKRRALLQECDEARLRVAEDLAQATAEAEELRGALAELNEWQRLRAAHEAELAELRTSLEREKRKGAEELAEAEQRAAETKAELQRQKEEELGHVRQAMFNAAYERLDEVTKQIVAENERLARELSKQAKQSDTLMRENKRLRDEAQELRRKVDMLGGLEKEAARRNQQLQRSIKALEQQLAQQQAPPPPPLPQPQQTNSSRPNSTPKPTTSKPSSAMARQLDEQSKHVRELEQEVERLRRATERMRGEVAAAEVTKEEAGRIRREMRELLDQHDQATWFLLSALDDAKGQAEAPPEARLDELGPEERRRVLGFFLSKLHTYRLAAKQGVVKATEPSQSRQRQLHQGVPTEAIADFSAPMEAEQQPPPT